MSDLTDRLKLTFDDEFDSLSASASGIGTTWQTTLPHNLRNIAGTGEVQYYSDSSVGVDPFSIDNGVLNITASKGSNPAGLPYNSGVLTTENSFSQLYGYFEINADLPSGQGMWPAFWLLPSSLSGTSELDVMEAKGELPDSYTSTVHSPADGISSADIPAGTDLTAGFHSYGMYWTPDTISFYLDGNLVAVTHTPADMNQPMFMLLNLAVASDVGPNGVSSASMGVDYVHAYAYDPSVAGPDAPLTTVLPGSVTGSMGQSLAVSGAVITDTDGNGNQQITANLSDKSLGILSVTAAGDASVTGNNNWSLTITGSLDDVNATLASLQYKNVQTGSTSAAPASDTLTLTASDKDGNFDSTRLAVTLQDNTTPKFISMTATATRVSAAAHDVFVFNASSMADPAANGGQANHIINFQTTADGGSDFLAFHGYDTSASLVFDHLAAPGGVANPSMQYYRIDSSAGSSPIFMVQMANGSGDHLTSADYGFYPS